MLVTIIELLLGALIKWVGDRLLKGRAMPLIRCVIKGCGQPVAYKGLCRACYKAAKTLVTKGGVTWDELGRKGLAKVETNKFLEAYEDQRRKDAKDRPGGGKAEEE